MSWDHALFIHCTSPTLRFWYSLMHGTPEKSPGRGTIPDKPFKPNASPAPKEFGVSMITHMFHSVMRLLMLKTNVRSALISVVICPVSEIPAKNSSKTRMCGRRVLGFSAVAPRVRLKVVVYPFASIISCSLGAAMVGPFSLPHSAAAVPCRRAMSV